MSKILKIGNRVLKIGSQVLEHSYVAPSYTVITDLGDTVYQSVRVQLNVPSTVLDRYILYKWHGTINTYGTRFGAGSFNLSSSDSVYIYRSRAHYAQQYVTEIMMEDWCLYTQFVKAYDGMYTYTQDGVICWTDHSWPNEKDLGGTIRFIVDQVDLVGHFYWRPDTNPDEYPNYKGYVVYPSSVPTATFLEVLTEANYAPKVDHISVVSSNDLQTLVDY